MKTKNPILNRMVKIVSAVIHSVNMDFKRMVVKRLAQEVFQERLHGVAVSIKILFGEQMVYINIFLYRFMYNYVCIAKELYMNNICRKNFFFHSYVIMQFFRFKQEHIRYLVMVNRIIIGVINIVESLILISVINSPMRNVENYLDLYAISVSI